MKKEKFKIEDILIQIYGELNRIRLIIGEKSRYGKRIKEADKKFRYNPFFEKETDFKLYKHLKNIGINFYNKLLKK